MPGNTLAFPSTKSSTTFSVPSTTPRSAMITSRSKRTCSPPSGNGPTRIPGGTSLTPFSPPSLSRQARTTSSARIRNPAVRVTGRPGRAQSARWATARSAVASGTRCRRATSMRWRGATESRRISTCRTRRRRPALLGLRGRRPLRVSGTVTASRRPAAAQRTNTCVRRRIRRSSTAGRRRRRSITRAPRHNHMVRVLLLGSTVSRLRDTGADHHRLGQGGTPGEVTDLVLNIHLDRLGLPDLTPLGHTDSLHLAGVVVTDSSTEAAISMVSALRRGTADGVEFSNAVG